MGGSVVGRRGPTLLTFYRRTGWALFAMALWAMACASPLQAADWVGAWGASEGYPSGPSISYQTIRQSMRLSLGGRALRIRVSNELGAGRLDIGALHVARPAAEPGTIDPASDRVVTFGGRRTVSIQPGMPMLSDPIPMAAAALDTLVISMFVPRTTGPTATHPSGSATTYIVDGDETSAPKLKDATRSTARFFISGIEVDHDGAQTVVAFGDSITDGAFSTDDANRRWPDLLAERLAKFSRPIAVVNAGISGNRILHDLPEAEYGPSALARFDRDALAVARVDTVILLESINDIGAPGGDSLPEQSVGAADIIAGMQQLIERAHTRGVRMIGATLTPFAGTTYPGYYSAEGEAKRQAVNRWVRESRAFDVVIDFDQVLRDPSHPDRMLPAYDCGDHLHPNDAGYRRMAEAVDLDSLAGG
jgi:lysophospholipase L1-like esterase